MAYFKVLLKMFFQVGVAAILAWFLVGQLDPQSIFFNLLALFLVFYLMTAWLWMFIRFFDEDFDTIIVTNERIIDTTQTKFLKLSISSTDLDEVQDARSSVAGFLGGIFHYGVLDIQTAGKHIFFELDYVSEPERYIDQIIELKETYIRSHPGA
jgi:uncharacterized membrane protein YfcA